MRTFNKVRCLLIPLISVAALVPLEAGAQALLGKPKIEIPVYFSSFKMTRILP